MTVSDLIAELKKLDPNLAVMAVDPQSGGLFDAEQAEVEAYMDEVGGAWQEKTGVVLR